MDEAQILEVTGKLDKIIDMLGMITEKIAAGPGKVRKKRAPSRYNLHIKDCMGNKSGKSMKECAATYVKEVKN